MAKIQIKSEKLTPFGGIFSIMEQFDALLAQTIDSTLGLRCTLFGYQYSEILRSLMCVYLCGGSCSEEIRFLSGVSILQLSFKKSLHSQTLSYNSFTINMVVAVCPESPRR